MGASGHRTGADADFPAGGSGREKLGFAIRQSLLQTEPQHWRSVEFFIREQFVEVSVRPSAAASVFDPESRDRTIYCGMALQRLKLTLRRHGSFGRIDLFPDLDQPDLVARVHLGSGGTRSHFEKELSDAMELKGSSHRLPTPISAAVLDWLSRAAAGERSWCEFARREGSRQQLMELVRSTERIRATEIRIENKTVTRSANDGWNFPRLTGAILHGRLARWRKPAVSIKLQAAATSVTETFESIQSLAPESTYAVLKTKTDDKHGWLAVGRMLGALLLHARGTGLCCTPFLNALRHSELRAELRTAIGHKGFMQVIVCFDGAGAELLAGPAQVFETMTSRQSA